jgi:hypothetical protein
VVLPNFGAYQQRVVDFCDVGQLPLFVFIKLFCLTQLYLFPEKRLLEDPPGNVSRENWLMVVD